MKRKIRIALKQQQPGSFLTKNEAQIVLSLKQGMTTKQIAAARGTRPQTVKNQLHLIFVKTGARSRDELLAIRLTDAQ
jgi:DNA-binding CsgD family transcriptional regulator